MVAIQVRVCVVVVFFTCGPGLFLVGGQQRLVVTHPGRYLSFRAGTWTLSLSISEALQFFKVKQLLNVCSRPDFFQVYPEHVTQQAWTQTERRNTRDRLFLGNKFLRQKKLLNRRNTWRGLSGLNWPMPQACQSHKSR